MQVAFALAVKNKPTMPQIQECVVRVSAGESIIGVSRSSGIGLTCLKKYWKLAKEGEPIVKQMRGRKPILTTEAENDVAEWVVGMQRSGYPVYRTQILLKANEIINITKGRSASAHSVGMGWYRRFLERHPMLTTRMAQKITLVHNNVNVGDLRQLFHTMVKLVVVEKISPRQIYNMDETSFKTKSNTKRVVVVRGSSNLWTKEPDVAFHLTIIAAVNALGGRHTACVCFAREDGVARCDEQM